MYTLGLPESLETQVRCLVGLALLVWDCCFHLIVPLCTFLWCSCKMNSTSSSAIRVLLPIPPRDRTPDRGQSIAAHTVGFRCVEDDDVCVDRPSQCEDIEDPIQYEGLQRQPCPQNHGVLWHTWSDLYVENVLSGLSFS